MPPDPPTGCPPPLQIPRSATECHSDIEEGQCIPVKYALHNTPDSELHYSYVYLYHTVTQYNVPGIPGGMVALPKEHAVDC